MLIACGCVSVSSAVMIKEISVKRNQYSSSAYAECNH